MSTGKFHQDLTVLPSPRNHWFILGESSSFMAELFRFVNYYELLKFTQIFEILKIYNTIIKEFTQIFED